MADRRAIPMARCGTPGLHVTASRLSELAAVLLEYVDTLEQTFMLWDDEGRGTFTKRELRRAIPVTGVIADPSDVARLFAMLDRRDTGRVSYGSLRRQLASVAVGPLPGVPSLPSLVPPPRKPRSRARLAGSSSLPKLPSTVDAIGGHKFGGAARFGRPPAGKGASESWLWAEASDPSAPAYGDEGFALVERVAPSQVLRSAKDLLAHGEGRITDRLRDALTRDSVRVIDLFQEWDEDGDGVVSRRDVKRALRRLEGGGVVRKVEAPLDDATDALFRLCRCHGDELTFKELNRVLRRGSTMKLPPSHPRDPVQPDEYVNRPPGAGGGGGGGGGGAGARKERGWLTAKTSVADLVGQVSAVRSAVLRGGALIAQAQEDVSVAQQLRASLVHNAMRVIDLFREWDTDGDGTVSKREFRKAMPALGLHAPARDVDELFDSFDTDGSGTVNFRELNSLLRRDVKTERKVVRHEKVVHLADTAQMRRDMQRQYAASLARLPDKPPAPALEPL